MTERDVSLASTTSRVANYESTGTTSIPTTIEIKHHYFPRDEFLGTTGGRSLVLILAGDEPVVDSQVENAMLYLSLAMAGVTKGRHTRVMLPVFNLDPARLQRALDILYSRYCTGTKSEAAF